MIFLWEAFILGLVGSLHCAGMCGPLALALPQTGFGNRGYFFGRIAYNAGRLLTYGLMGIVFGLFGKAILMAGIQRWVSITLGVLFLAGLLTSKRLALVSPVTRLVGFLKTKMSSLLRRRSTFALLLLGILNGLLPCGLVYLAGAGAAVTGGVLSGITYMAAFGAGTIPMMLAISLSGRLVPFSIRLKLAKAIPVSIFLLAVLLILRGMSLGIPYVSPDLSAGSCCSH